MHHKSKSFCLLSKVLEAKISYLMRVYFLIRLEYVLNCKIKVSKRYISIFFPTFGCRLHFMTSKVKNILVG